MVRRHLEGIVAWAQTRQTNGFLEALNGLFQAAKRRARGFGRFSRSRKPSLRGALRESIELDSLEAIALMVRDGGTA